MPFPRRFHTEYIEGCTLEAALDIAAALSENRTRLIVAELACAIGHIHSLGILHRDIKVWCSSGVMHICPVRFCRLQPANVMVHSDGHVRLIDLGLAALVQPPRFSSIAAGPIETPQDTPAASSTLVALLQVRQSASVR